MSNPTHAMHESHSLTAFSMASMCMQLIAFLKFTLIRIALFTCREKSIKSHDTSIIIQAQYELLNPIHYNGSNTSRSDRLQVCVEQRQ